METIEAKGKDIRLRRKCYHLILSCYLMVNFLFVYQNSIIAVIVGVLRVSRAKDQAVV